MRWFGNRKDSQKQVHISCQCEPGKELSIIIRDEGAGFDPVKVAPHGITNDGKSGIPLMRLLMDEVHFERNGREIHMRKRAIPKKAG